MDRRERIRTARLLRGQGLLLKDIAAELGVSVATAGAYCKGVLPKGTPGSAEITRNQYRDVVEAMYTAGRPISEIAKELGIPASTIYDWRRNWGIPRNSRAVYVTPELRARIATAISRDPDRELAELCRTLYMEDGLSTPEIAEKLGFSPQTIGAWLRSLGIELRRSPNTRTRERLRQANLGPKRYNWKGGITPAQMRLRNSMQMRDARIACFERDDYTCRSCGQKGGKLNAHHVWPFQRFPELMYEVRNLVTLCKACHDEYHKAAGGHVKVAIGPFYSNGNDDDTSVREETIPYHVVAYAAAA